MAKNGKTLGVPSERPNGQSKNTRGTSSGPHADGHGNMDFPTDVSGSDGILDYFKRFGD